MPLAHKPEGGWQPCTNVLNWPGPRVADVHHYHGDEARKPDFPPRTLQDEIGIEHLTIKTLVEGLMGVAERLKAKGKPPKVVICAVMRKLLVLTATLIKRQEFYDPTKGLVTT